MNLENTQTANNLLKAFTKELETSAEYSYYAFIARETGNEHAAELLEAVAKNEAEHARHEFFFLRELGDLKTGLGNAVRGEAEDATVFYPRAAEVAESEGLTEVADFFRGLVKYETRHGELFRQLLEGEQGGEAWKGRTVGSSAVVMAQIMLPSQANPAGYVHGGELMKLMDNAAGAVAARHSRSNVVTALVEDINFLHPVRIGDLVTVEGKLTFVSRSSMSVRLDVYVEDLFGGERAHALTAYYIMVALGPDGRPGEIPPLIVTTEEEEHLYQEALARYEARKRR